MDSETDAIPQLADIFNGKWGVALRAGISYIIAFIVVFIISALGVIAMYFLLPLLAPAVFISGDTYPYQIAFRLLFIINACVLFLLAGYFIAKKDLKKAYVDELGLTINKNSAVFFISGMIIGLGLTVLINLVFVLIGLDRFDSGSFSSRMHSFDIFMEALIIVTTLAGTVASETLFRGYLQRTLMGSYGVLPGIAATALLYGLWSNLNPLSIFSAIVLGLIIGFMYQQTRSLFFTIGFASAYSFFYLEILSFAQLPAGVPAGAFYASFGMDPGTWLMIVPMAVNLVLAIILYAFCTMDSEKKKSMRESLLKLLKNMTGGDDDE